MCLFHLGWFPPPSTLPQVSPKIPPQTLISKIKEGNERNRGSQGVRLLGLLNSWQFYLWKLYFKLKAFAIQGKYLHLHMFQLCQEIKIEF